MFQKGATAMDEMDEQEQENVLNLLAEKKYSSLKQILCDMNPIDLAELLSDLPDDKRPVLFRLLGKEQGAKCFVEMDPDVQMQLIHSFSDTELRGVLDEMYLDDTVDLIEEMPANVVKRSTKFSNTPTIRPGVS